jgi:protoporphyrinogen IX oxidase
MAMDWILVIHLIAVISWFAGLFYLPRLFVYHAMCKDDIGNERFKVMERKLFYGIMLPASIIAFISGHILISLNHWNFTNAPLWLHLKLICVLGLFIYMFFCWRYMRDFKKNANKHSHVFYRWFNEIPTVMLVLIVIFVIVRPF